MSTSVETTSQFVALLVLLQSFAYEKSDFFFELLFTDIVIFNFSIFFFIIVVPFESFCMVVMFCFMEKRMAVFF